MSIDLDAYFRASAMTARAMPTLETLQELHRLHPQAIAFENLDPLLGRPVKLDPASLQAKLVARRPRRLLLRAEPRCLRIVLRALGFKVHEATARVRWCVPPGVTRRAPMRC